MLEDLPNLVGPSQLLAVQPHSLPHKEGEVVHMLPGLDLEPLQQLIHTQIHLPVQLVKESIQVTLGFDGNPGQINRSKAQIPPLVALLA